MKTPMFLAYALLATATARVAVKRWINQSTPSGPTDPNVVSDCTYWAQIQSGDTCGDIEDYFGITQAQFTSYNPSLGSDCSGLTVGHSYCVEENYGIPPATTSSTKRTSSTSKPVTASSTSPAATSPTAPSPTQSGLAADCVNYYKVMPGDGCSAIVDQYGTFTLSDFYGWNPSVGDSCQGLLAGYYVCVGTSATPTSKPTPTPTPTSGPSPEQTGIVAGCQRYYQVASGDYCQGIVDKFGTFSLNQFYAWNPAVGKDCQNLQAGYYVCIGVAGTPTVRPSSTASPSPSAAEPSPTQTGIISTCTKYYKAVGGDSCAAISDHFGTFSTRQFIGWNPAVKTDCSQLYVGYYYCIAVPGTPTTKSATPSPTPTPKGPQPQQPGTISTCQTYYQVRSGDSCFDIEQRYGITAANFNKWNPGVKSDCSGLFAGYYVCVKA